MTEKNKFKHFDSLFYPNSVAFVGATESVGKWGFIIYNNLISGGFQGKLYPVNPGRNNVLGYKAYPSVKDIPDDVDLAVFTIPAGQMETAIEDCVAKGVKAGVVITAGFKELGGKYADLESELVEKARAGNMILVGPNCQGVCCPETKLYPWIPPNFHPPSGSVGVISQSGNLQTLLIGEVVKSGFGISKSVSSGNEAGLRAEDYFAYLGDDPKTDVIIGYLEGINQGRLFIEQTRLVAQKKPVILFKGGATHSGIAAASSHTGAMAVRDRVFDAACRQSGIIRASRIDEVGIIAASFLNRPLPKGRRVGIITGGGGLGVIAADVCTKLGLDVVNLSEKTLKKIGTLMPDWWVPGNPVDMVAGLKFGTRKPVAEILMASGEIDSLLFLRMGPPPKKGEGDSDHFEIWKALAMKQADLAQELFDLMHEYKIPVYIASNLFHESGLDISEFLGEKRMTVYMNVNAACQAIRAMAYYFECIEKM